MYGVPPLPVTVASPTVPPLQAILVWPVMVATTPSTGSVIVVLEVYIHPFASVTVTLYVPAVKPVAVVVPCAGEVLHKMVYGAVPPAIPLMVAVPLLPPAQLTLVLVNGFAVIALPAVMFIPVMMVSHRFASVTVMLYNPVANPVNIPVGLFTAPGFNV